jgi:hypothetical protein
LLHYRSFDCCTIFCIAPVVMLCRCCKCGWKNGWIDG